MTDICSGCVVDLTYDSNGLVACCDEAWVIFGSTCAFLTSTWALDCTGCNCPGDSPPSPLWPPQPPQPPPAPPSPPMSPSPSPSPPAPPASPTGVSDTQFACGYDGDHIAFVETTAALVAAVADASVSCVKLAPVSFAFDATVQVDRPLAIAADDGPRGHGPATFDGGGSVGPLISLGASTTLALFNVILTNATGSDYGGALYAAPGSTLDLSSVAFLANSVDPSNIAGQGGGLCFLGLALRMADCTFADNRAAAGGGMYVGPQSASGPLAGVTSGEPFELEVERCTFTSNAAVHNWGGAATIALEAACGITGGVRDSTFQGNSAHLFGGAISALACEHDALAISRTDFTANAVTAAAEEDALGGGAIFMYEANLNLAGCAITANSAVMALGGGIGSRKGRLVLTQTLIRDNLAAQGANLHLRQQASYVMPAPDGRWLPAATCLVYREACSLDAACTAAVEACSMEVVENATDCMPFTFQQPCDWDAQPELLGELLFPIPLGATDVELPYTCGVGLLGGTSANLADQTTAMCAGFCPAGYYCEAEATVEAAVCPTGSFCPLGSILPTPCPAGTSSNRTGLRASTQCVPVTSGYYAPTGSSLPEPCPVSGFVCPGAAHDHDNDPPGSQPIAVDSGKAVALVTATSSTTQISFTLGLAASDTDGDGKAAVMAVQLADFFAVATTALEVTAQQTVLAVAILSDEPDATALVETIDATDSAELSIALSINVSAPDGLYVTAVEVATEVEVVEACPAGYWCSAGNRIPCGTGTYNPLPEQIDMGACTACPANSDSAEASDSLSDCTCELGYYDELQNASEVRCVLCPVGSDCTAPGVTLGTLPLLQGYWRITRSSANLLQCGDGSSADTGCVGGVGSGEGSEICKPWLKGPYCTLCNVTDGSRYYNPGSSSCLECENGNTAASVCLILGVVAAAAVMSYALQRVRPRLAQLQPRVMNVATTLHLRCKLKQLVSLCQIVSQMGRVFVVKMPASLTKLLSWLDIFSLDLGALGLPTGCLGLRTIEEQLLFYIFVPLIIGLIVLIMYVTFAAQRLRGEHGVKKVLKEGALTALPSLLMLSFLAFPMVATLAFRAFSCEEFEGGEAAYLYLYADYSIDCNDDVQYGRVLKLAYLAIVLYPVAVPISYVLLLRAARDAIVHERPSELSRALDFLHRDLEPRCYLWEIAEIAKKLFLVGFIALISPGQAVQLIIGFGFCMIFLFFTAIYDPFKADDDDLFAMLCNFVLSTCMFLCVVLSQASLAEAVDAYLADAMKSTYNFDSGVISALIIGALALVACVTVAALAWEVYKGMNQPVIHLKATRQAPELPFAKGALWHLFLSHIWSTGQDQNATIKRQLCLLLPGVSVFLDVDDLESIGDLELYVEQSQVVQLFCSKGYFKSCNCLREIQCTLEKKKRFCLMFDPDKGGATLNAIRDDECPDELRSAVFDGREVIRWYRISDFQLVSLKLLAEQLLLGCQGNQNKQAMPVYVPRELARRQWGFRPHLDVHVSAHNPGSHAAMMAVKDELKRLLLKKKQDRNTSIGRLSLTGQLDDEKGKSVGLEVVETERLRQLLRGDGEHTRVETSEIPRSGKKQGSGTSFTRKVDLLTKSSEKAKFVLYLSRETWLGEAGQALAEEVRLAREGGAHLVMVHSTPDNADGCEFDHVFSTTPHDLIQDGLYRDLALALHPPPFRQVSACLIARALGATNLDSAWGPITKLLHRADKDARPPMLCQSSSVGSSPRSSMRRRSSTGKASGSAVAIQVDGEGAAASPSAPQCVVAPTTLASHRQGSNFDEFLEAAREDSVGSKDRPARQRGSRRSSRDSTASANDDHTRRAPWTWVRRYSGSLRGTTTPPHS